MKTPHTDEENNYALLKHIAELADKHCPDLGVEHQARPAMEVIESALKAARADTHSEYKPALIEHLDGKGDKLYAVVEVPDGDTEVFTKQTKHAT